MLNIDISKSKRELLDEIVKLQSQLDETQETLNAIINGEIDAIVTSNGSNGPEVYTLESADYLYRKLVQEMNEGVATLTNNGTIFYSNAKLASILKIPLEKITGQILSDFIIPEDLQTYLTIINKGSETRSSGEISIKSVDGNIIPVYISINTLKDLNGVYVVITDLSQQKSNEELKVAHEQLNNSLLALSESEERYKNIIENIQDAYIRADKNGKIIMASTSAARMYKFSSPDEMIGISALSLYKFQEDRNNL